MDSKLILYNTLTRRKQEFEPLHPPFVGLYVCGPTVYGDPHLGHARPAITFDLLFRYLRAAGYKVRYVRNITDVGHLENDADSGEDKIAKKARLEELEPMEVAQYYTNRYHDAMQHLNVLPPSIEPHASGHIIEQIAMIQKILDHGFAYISNGSVYFDVEAYNKKYHYGKLSGRVLDEMMSHTRTLDGQEDKRNPFDFALWKKAAPEHIMRWPSPWSDGFPGWHMECSAMSTRYLGETFDIHGGGMDLMFPHHECEIAQSTAACGHDSARYWMHNNMITINEQKMGKSLGNFITLEELMAGNHKLLTQPYSPMTIRFFALPQHARFLERRLASSRKGIRAADERSLHPEQITIFSHLQHRHIGSRDSSDCRNGRRSELTDRHIGAVRMCSDDQPDPRRQTDDFGRGPYRAKTGHPPVCLRHFGIARRSPERQFGAFILRYGYCPSDSPGRQTGQGLDDIGQDPE